MAKRIVIVGAGVVGTTSAQRLSAEGHDVVLIERDETVARELAERLDVQVMLGNGSSLAVLRDAELESADLLLAVTNSDEVNMITALIAGSQFKVDTKVVRLRSQEYLDNISELAANWHGKTYGISPDRVAADRIVSILRVPHAVDVTELLDHRLVVAGFRIEPGCPLLGRTLAEFRRENPRTTFLLSTIYRGNEVIRPAGDTTLAIGDIAYFSAVPDDLPKVIRLLGFAEEKQQRVIVGGGGHIGRMVAEEAIKLGLVTIVIRRDRKEAEKLAVDLPEALVLSGDITREEILLEAGVDRAANFVAVTNSHEINLLSSILAKQCRASRIVTLIDNRTYIGVANAMNIDSIVSPRLASVGEILKFVRGVHVEEVASLPSERVEVSAVDVDEASPLAGKALRDVHLPSECIVAALLTKEGVIVPSGETVIEIGTKAVLFTKAEHAHELEKLID